MNSKEIFRFEANKDDNESNHVSMKQTSFKVKIERANREFFFAAVD